MILYVNGDSHSNGNFKNIARGHYFTDIIAKYFNFEIFNDAEAAASTDRIIRTTQEFLSNTPKMPDMILIGWGAWDREEWYHQGKYYNIMKRWGKTIPDSLETEYQTWLSNLGPEYLQENSKKSHDKIFELHQSLTSKKIPHLFFNCMFDFFGIPNDEKKDWSNSHIGPYENDLSYYWYLTKQQFASDDWYHFGEDGHQAWADFLIDYIKENKLL